MTKRIRLTLSVLQILSSVAIGWINFQEHEPLWFSINVVLTVWFCVHAVWLWRLESWDTNPDLDRLEELMQLSKELKVTPEQEEVADVISGTLSLEEAKVRLIERKRIWEDVKTDCFYLPEKPSHYLKCTANPSSPCSECTEYKKIEKPPADTCPDR